MRSLHNIEKSAFRRHEYVGYAGGVWRVRKRGTGGWEAEKFYPQTRTINRDFPMIVAPTLEAMSAKLAALPAPAAPRGWAVAETSVEG